jgi:two-component system chemotaxis sensor kinase CheA
MTDEDEFIAVFREEAAERLDAIDELLLGLEAGRAEPGALDSLFREFHTIKGAAGLVELDDVHALAHAVEDLLDAVRRSGGPFPAIADTLFRAAGQLREQLRGTAGATSPLVDELARLRVAVEEGRPALEPQPEREASADPGAPLPSAEPGRGIRVPAAKLDHMLDVVGETVLHRRRLDHALSHSSVPVSHELADELARGDRLLDTLQSAAVTMRTVPLRSITGPFPRAVRDLAAGEEKQAELEIAGADTELDRVILERLVDPLVHLLRNAIHHGLESPSERAAAGKQPHGRIELRAKQRGALVEVTVADDGRGVPERLLAEAEQGVALADLLARAGFSTAAAVTDVAGRGVGLDAVKRQVESLGGRLEVHSRPGVGTEVMLLLPLTLALLDVLLVERGTQALALPLASVFEAVRADAPLELAGKRSVELRGEPVTLADVADVLGAEAPPLPASPPALVTAAAAGGRVALLCDRILGEEEVVVRALGPLLTGIRGYLGAAVLGDGRVALILDPTALDQNPVAHPRDEPAVTGAAETSDRSPTILVVEDSLTVRALQRSILEAAGYRVEVAADGIEAWERVRGDRTIGLVVSDVDMPRMDGFALVQTIRADPEHAALPVVLVTSRAGEDDRRRGLRAGADAYLEKARFDQRGLLEAVERLLER